MLLLDSASREDLEWWLTHTTAPMGGLVCPTDPSITVYSISAVSSAEWSVSHRGCMVPKRGTSSHKLPEVTSCLPDNQHFQEDLAECCSPAAFGQGDIGELHKGESGHNVKSFVPTSGNNLDMVHRAKHYSPSRALSWTTKFSG